MDRLLDYLDMIEDILEGSNKVVPFSTKISVEKDRIIDIISDIRLNLPTEIRKAERIIEEYDKVLREAESKAAAILREAAEDAKMLTNNHEIYRRAAEQATEIQEEAKQTARDIRLNAMDYADEILEKVEKKVLETRDNVGQQNKIAIENIEQQSEMATDYFSQIIDVLYENRQQLRGGNSHNDSAPL